MHCGLAWQFNLQKAKPLNSTVSGLEGGIFECRRRTLVANTINTHRQVQNHVVSRKVASVAYIETFVHLAISGPHSSIIVSWLRMAQESSFLPIPTIYPPNLTSYTGHITSTS